MHSCITSPQIYFLANLQGRYTQRKLQNLLYQSTHSGYIATTVSTDKKTKHDNQNIKNGKANTYKGKES